MTRLFLILFSVLFCTNVFAQTFKQINTDQKVVALTFDDGPEVPYTEQILAVLAKHGVKATFYVLGGNAKAHPELIKKTMAAGHEIGSHSMYHQAMKNRSVDAIMKDLQSTDAIIKKAGYQKEITFRAPYGITSDNLRTALARLNKDMVLFTFLAQDWTKISADEIYNNVMKQLKPGLIIVLHDGGHHRENTVKATDRLIESLQKQGYRFLTVSEILKLQSR